METLQPKLRFLEFKGDWGKKKLSDISTKITDGTHDTPKQIEKGKPYLTAIHIKDGFIDYDNCYFLSEIEHDKIYKRCNPEYGDLLIVNIGAGTATCAMNRVDYEFSMKNVALVKPNPNIVNSNFLEQVQRKKTFKLFNQLSSGGAQPFLSLKELNNISDFFPSLQEQTKIANFLSSIDEKLNLLKEKKELLEDYKKGIMQKIFNQEIRFKDDNGNDFEDWKTSILSDIVYLFHGFQFRTSDFTSKGIAVIKISNVIGNNLDLNNLTFIKKERFEDFKSFEIKNDDILMSLTGNIGRIIEVKDKPFTILQNYRVGKFIPLDENVINKPFLKYLLASDLVFGRFSQLANQSAQANFGKQDMDKINISYPPIAEQNKIANFLSAIDEKIELVSNQIQDTQEYKKGLLQQMFV
tara:strand:- start:3664 stop:4893 length:1230 start_codon:yes stop_codon:yes gene_type:complete